MNGLKRARGWARGIVLDVVDGKIHHSGMKRPLRIKKDKYGMKIGCTYVTCEALELLNKIDRGEI